MWLPGECAGMPTVTAGALKWEGELRRAEASAAEAEGRRGEVAGDEVKMLGVQISRASRVGGRTWALLLDGMGTTGRL